MYVCPVCSAMQHPQEPIRGVLRVLLPYDQLKITIDQFSFTSDELLPVTSQFMTSFPVGNTPLFRSDRIERELGFEHLFFKNDSLNPTGSINDRASLSIASFAVKRNEKKVVLASTGNLAASMASISAAADLNCVAFIPATISRQKLAQILTYGTHVVLIDGSYDEAYDLAIDYKNRYGGICGNAVYNPYSIEGMKTIAYEIYRQLDHSVPDFIFIPSGNGTLLSSIYKGFYDMFQFDWFVEMPRLVAVQAEGNDAIVNALSSGVIKNISGKPSIADSLNISIPRNAHLALKDIESTCGFGINVNNQEIRCAQDYLAKHLGIFVEPAAAVAYAGFVKYKHNLAKEAKIVLMLTGCGLKSASDITKRIKYPKPIPPNLSSIPEEI